MTSRARRRSQAGFNLIEVLIAMALLSTVLLSVVTLFFMGRSNVYSGKQLTRATSVSVHASEDMNALSGSDLMESFNVVKGAALASNKVSGVTYPNSIVRSTKVDAGGTNDPRGYLDRWKSFLGADRVLNGNLTVVIMPTDYADATDVTTARLIKVRIVTEWSERNRSRNVFMDMAKFNRSLQ